MQFKQNIIERAKNKKNQILFLPESTDERMLEATNTLLKDNICEKIVLFGDTDVIHTHIKTHHVANTDRIEIINPLTDSRKDEFIAELVELRKHRNLSAEQASEHLKNPLWYAAMMMRKKQGHAMVAGAVNTTANVLRPAILIVGTAPDSAIVSSCFLMESPDENIGGHNGQYIFSDCGTIPHPNVEELAEITNAAAHSCKTLLQTEPLIAMASFSTLGSAEHDDVTKVRDALALVKKKFPHLKVDGELQMDAVLSKRVAKTKAPQSPTAGIANTVIFPDLTAGNIAYKTAQYFGKMNAYGPLIQGLAAPINDLSRGCTAEEIVIAAAITICQGE